MSHDRIQPGDQPQESPMRQAARDLASQMDVLNQDIKRIPAACTIKWRYGGESHPLFPGASLRRSDDVVSISDWRSPFSARHGNPDSSYTSFASFENPKGVALNLTDNVGVTSRHFLRLGFFMDRVTGERVEELAREHRAEGELDTFFVFNSDGESAKVVVGPREAGRYLKQQPHLTHLGGSHFGDAFRTSIEPRDIEYAGAALANFRRKVDVMLGKEGPESHKI